jgi:L-fuculose-phosphate aldolase
MKQEMIDIAKKLYAKNMLAAADGNISYRVNENEILITPAGKAKTSLQPEDIATITIDNKIIQGNPSSERLMHLTIYQHCPKASCIIHAHPPKAIAWTIAYPELAELPSECLSELILAVGRIPIASYARPGTQAMGDVLKPFLPACRVLVLARHGALSWGEDLQEALNGIERLEHTAEILMYAKTLGGITNLSADEVSELRSLRKIIGERSL